MGRGTTELRLKVWLEREGRVIFGEGREQLLEAVARNGSLAGAARELDMSYRAAWGRIKASEERLGCSLVERGEDRRGGMRLTPQAETLLKLYTELHEQCEQFLHQAGKKLKAELQLATSQSPQT
ncbi:MAG: LysR family transcriptional regulator [Desulfarculaceae bacterium]|jgi:molybdate transport system regulatory protein